MLRANSQQDRIAETLDMCELHWMATEVPVANIEQMRDELHQHLREAVEEGKSVDAVVGGDVIAFAEEWAAPNRVPKSPRWKILGWTHAFSGYALLLLIVGHLLNWSLAFPTTPIVYLYGFVAISLSSVWFNSMPVAGSLRFEGPPLRQMASCIGAALGTMGVLTAINLVTGIGETAPLSDWSLTGTLVVFLISLIPGKPRQDLDALPPRWDQDLT